MSIQAPVILLPSGGSNYSTDTPNQTLSGTTEANTSYIQVNGSTHGVSYTPGDIIWAWNGTLDDGVNELKIVAVEQLTGLHSAETVINITLVRTPNYVSVSAPTGVKLRRYQDKVEVICAKNPEEQVVGYNFYVYTTSGGNNGTYAKINTDIVSSYSFYEDMVEEKARSIDTAGNIRITSIVDEVIRVFYYSIDLTQDRFDEMVAAGSLPSVAFIDTTPLFFVVTAVIYDTTLGRVSESTNSFELEGSPLTITTGINTLPTRKQDDIILTYSQELLAGNPNIDLKPGTVMRDMLDPISEEQARIYVIQDFMARSLSVSALLDFDDSDHDGVSDPVTSSLPKKALQLALGLTTGTDVQNFIDAQFDALGSNVNVTRRGAVPAIGTVVFYTATPPVRVMTVYEGAVVSTLGDVDAGIAAQSYTTLATKSLDPTNKEAFWNPATSRYELTIDVTAVNSGETGNTDSYTIKSVGSGVDSDFQVENPDPVRFGADRETNNNMATRIGLSLHTDTGTGGGYTKVAAGVPGVRYVRVEEAGDDLMRRDYDSVRDKHVGGKVDIYIQGSKEIQKTEKIAFSFQEVQAIQGGQTGEIFNIVNVASFQFKTTNPRVTAHTPIFEVTQVYNSTRAKSYDLGGYTITGDGLIVNLNETSSTNKAIGLASSDIIRVDYKYRSFDVFTLRYQPVLSITSVVGALSGTLSEDNYELVRLQDVLEEGNSTIAQDGFRLIYANGLPVSEFQTITGEQHVLTLGVREPLNNLGVENDSIIVSNTTGTITYDLHKDYTIATRDSGATEIEMVEGGRISSGQTVAVSYVSIENFTVTYTTNELLTQVQNEVNKMKHACADAIIKQSVENKIDFAMTVIPKAGVTNLSLLTSKIRTAIANLVYKLGIGQPLTQSAVVATVNSLSDVQYVVLPLTKMAKADGSFIARDDIGTVIFQLYNEGMSTSYITADPVLRYNTIDKGGPENLFRGVFEDNMPLVLQDDPLLVSEGSGRAYIQSDGRLIVSTRDSQLPDLKNYQVAYYVYGETGSHDIGVTTLEYLSVGDLSVSYDIQS